MIDKIVSRSIINKFSNHPYDKTLTKMDAIYNLSKNKTSTPNQRSHMLQDKMNDNKTNKNHWANHPTTI